MNLLARSGADAVLAQAELSLLEMLLEEASEADLQDALARLRDQGRVSDELLERLSRAALALHRARLADRRQSVGLTVLGDTAVDLATRRDLDELLAEICRRARMLLGTEAAYIMLADECDTYVRATDGIVSDAFRAMRIPLGAGLGGLVARTGRPASTSDYANDARLRHLPDIDHRVAEESLRAIAAVPLLRGKVVRGVVISGSRSSRKFEPQEMAMFASLAAHAAVAIENAELLAESRATLSELAGTHARLRVQNEQVQRTATINAELADAALRGASAEALLEALVASAPGRIELIAVDGAVQMAAGTSVPEATEWIHPVAVGPEPLGTLRWFRSSAEGIEPEVLARSASLLAGLLMAHRARTEAEHRHLSRLLEDALEGRGRSAADAHGLLARAGLPADGAHIVLVAAPPPTAQRWAWLRAARLAAESGAVVGDVGGRVVLVTPGADADAVAQRWAEPLAGPAGEPATIGVARNDGGPATLQAAYREARGVLHLLLALEREGACASAEMLGIFGHMLVEEPGNLRGVVDRCLRPVIDWDASSSGNLLSTLSAFFSQSGHLANTARELGIHINTLYRRITRVDELLGEDWQTPDRRLELHLAVRLHALEQQLERGAGAGGESPRTPAPSGY